MSKKGFIATSMLYSFFIVFIMVIVTNVLLDVNRTRLLNRVKQDVRTSFINDASFTSYSILNKTYTVGENVSFAGEVWQVIKNNSTSVDLILKRILNKDEIMNSLPFKINVSDTAYFSTPCTNDKCYIRCCRFSLGGSTSCYFYTNTIYSKYSYGKDEAGYQKSLPYILVSEWLNKHDALQNAIRRGKLRTMTYSDKNFSYSTYIRIPLASEVSTSINWGGSEKFHLINDISGTLDSKTYIYSGSNKSLSDITIDAGVRPIISVLKG